MIKFSIKLSKNEYVVTNSVSVDLRCIEMRLRPGLRPGLHRGSLQRSPDPVGGFQGPDLW